MTFKSGQPIAVLSRAARRAGPALAQSAERVAAHTDWSVFVAGEPKECYIVSPPTTLGRAARRPDGRGPARRHPAVRRVPPRRERLERGQLHRRLSVPRRAARSSLDGRLGQLHARARAGRRQRMGLDRPADDSRVVAALRRGATAKLTGTSSRGTDDRGHLLAHGLHRRRRGRRGPLPLRRAAASGNLRPGVGYVGAAPRAAP